MAIISIIKIMVQTLSYDIIKAHGGELRVETKEARQDKTVEQEEGTTFTILLPIIHTGL